MDRGEVDQVMGRGRGGEFSLLSSTFTPTLRAHSHPPTIIADPPLPRLTHPRLQPNTHTPDTNTPQHSLAVAHDWVVQSHALQYVAQVLLAVGFVDIRALTGKCARQIHLNLPHHTHLCVCVCVCVRVLE